TAARTKRRGVIKVELAEEVAVVGGDPAACLIRREMLDVHLDQRVKRPQPDEQRAFPLAHPVNDVVDLDLSTGARLCWLISDLRLARRSREHRRSHHRQDY